MKKIILSLVVVLVLITVFALDRLESFEIAAKASEEIEFTSGGHRLSGTLYLPKTDPPYNVVFFIHGDGPQDRTSNGDYVFIMNHLLKEGLACFSYDKAGVGASEGNWLDQTMKDRGLEVEKALELIKDRPSTGRVGLLAFSQGGWVVSEVAQSSVEVDYMVVVGGAIDWMDQHMYYESKIADRMGFNQTEKKAYIDYVKNYDELILMNDYEAYKAYVSEFDYGSPMSKERFHFAHLNTGANALDGIKHIQAPFLGIFGGKDQNVNVQNSYGVYKKTFDQMGKTNYRLEIFPDASHSLLKSEYEGRTNRLLLHSFLFGDKIFVEGYLNTMSDWIKAQ